MGVPLLAGGCRVSRMPDRTEVQLLRSDASFVCSALGSTVLRTTVRGSQLDLLDGSQVLPNAAAVNVISGHSSVEGHWCSWSHLQRHHGG